MIATSSTRGSDDRADRVERRRRTAGVLLGAFIAAAFLAACNTTAGVGRDMEAAGDALEDAAEDAKD